MFSVGNKIVSSRLLLGTAQYPSLAVMREAIITAKTAIITVSLRRQQQNTQNDFWDNLKTLSCELLPNTAGCHNAHDAIQTAEMARELFQTNWIKLEVIGDSYTLQPNPFELVKAARTLIERGFEVFPYCTEDLVVCQHLVDVGCRILMPWAAPIGTGKGLLNPYALSTLRDRFPDTCLIIDAGIGKPSDAVKAMELGFDAVLLNTAVANALYPIKMAAAFRDAVTAGRSAFEAGCISERETAHPSTSLIDTLFWHQEQS